MEKQPSLNSASFDPVWNEKYAEGFVQYAPWDAVVIALFRATPRHKPRHEIRVLEIACGTCSNLLFAARMGFDVTGLDASEKAVALAKEFFAQSGLQGRVDLGNFTQLPYADNSFDMVIDRCGISHTGFDVAHCAIAEVHRVLCPGGVFFWIPFSDEHSSAASGRQGDTADTTRVHGGLRRDIAEGDIIGNGQACFYGKSDVQRLLPAPLWRLEKLEHMEYVNVLEPYRSVYAEWHVTARKTTS